MRVFRLDGCSGGLKSPQKLRGGRLRVDSWFTKPGVFPYRQDDGSTIQEYRPSAEVFSAKSVESWHGVPVTDGHPSDLVTSETWRQHAIGHMADDIRQDGDKLAGSQVLSDKTGVERVLTGSRKELSGGYWTEIDETPGVTAGDPFVPDGIRYDRRQTDIEGNHVAHLPANDARLGRDMTMRLDSSGHQLIPIQVGEQDRPEHLTPAPRAQESGRQLRLDAREISMKIRLDGKSYDLSDEKDLARYEEAQAARDAKATELSAANVTLTAEVTELRARADAADARLAERDAEIPKLVEQGIAAGVKAHVDRLALEAHGAKVLGAEAKFDGKTDDEVKASIRAGMEAAIKKADPDAKFDGLSDEYVRGRFDTLAKPAERSDERGTHPTLGQITPAPTARPTDMGALYRSAQAALQESK